MKQTESHWSCVAHGNNFLFLQWDDHNEKKKKKKKKEKIESHWSCVGHGTCFLFLQWDDHNKTKRDPLVLCRSWDQFSISPVRLPPWNKQRAIGPVSLTGPVSYFPSEMTTMKQLDSHWSCIAHGTSFLFPQWDDHTETNKEPLVLCHSRDQFPISPMRWPQWNKQRAIGPVSLTGLVSYFPSEMTTLKQTESHWSCIAERD